MPVSHAAAKRIPAPPNDLSVLQNSGSNRVKDLENWLMTLPATQASRISTELYQVLPEISRLKIKPVSKLEMLELVHPYLVNCIETLKAGLQNQPLLLPEKQVKTAAINQALQRHANIGYATVAVELLNEGKSLFKKHQLQEMGIALHRAIDGYGMQLYRSLALYIRPPATLWNEMNACYLIAEEHNIHRDILNRQSADTLGQLTITQVYARNLLLAAAQTQQLRQIDQDVLFGQLNTWCRHGELSTICNESENSFAIDLSSNKGPSQPRKLDFKDVSSVRYLNAQKILEYIKEDYKSDKSSLFGDHIIHHLLRQWEQHPERLERRVTVSGNMELVIGLKASHFHIAGHREFEEFNQGLELKSESAEYFSEDTSDRKDVWHGAYDAEKESTLYDPGESLEFDGWGEIREDNTEKKEEDPDQGLNVHLLPIQDQSPSGCSLLWKDSANNELQTGELILTRLAGNRNWQAGIIRWVQQQKTSCRLGIQLLGENLSASSAKLIPVTGDYGPPMRALQLEDPADTDSTGKIILPPSPFKEGQKISLNNGDKHRTLLLEKTIVCSGSLSVFQFRALEEIPDESDSDDQW